MGRLRSISVHTCGPRIPLRRPFRGHLSGNVHSYACELSPLCRQLSQHKECCSGRDSSTVCSASPSLYGLDPSKLTVTLSSGAGDIYTTPRRYTLTHSDLTGRLQLSVGLEYNKHQLSGWYLQLVRDEVLAEWRINLDGAPELHISCHVSSRDTWYSPVPPALRSRVFQREMPLVLKSIAYGDRDFLQSKPHLLRAMVFVHLASHIQALNIRLQWGVLGEEETWKQQHLSFLELWWQMLLSTPRQESNPAEGSRQGIVLGGKECEVLVDAQPLPRSVPEPTAVVPAQTTKFQQRAELLQHPQNYLGCRMPVLHNEQGAEFPDRLWWQDSCR